nr:hypothetical protein [Paraburkholderia aspalathi]
MTQILFNLCLSAAGVSFALGAVRQRVRFAVLGGLMLVLSAFC